MPGTELPNYIFDARVHFPRILLQLLGGHVAYVLCDLLSDPNSHLPAFDYYSVVLLAAHLFPFL